MNETDGVLENWFYDRDYGVVWGLIYGDSKGRFADGSFIHTSSLKPTGKLEEGATITTRNSSYLLGKKAVKH